MKSKDVLLLEQAYTEHVRFTTTVNQLIAEGMTFEEIETIMLQEGKWEDWKAKGASLWQKAKGVGSTMAGKAQEKAGQVLSKAGDLAMKGIQAVGGNVDPNKNQLTKAGKELQDKGSKKFKMFKMLPRMLKFKAF